MKWFSKDNLIKPQEEIEAILKFIQKVSWRDDLEYIVPTGDDDKDYHFETIE